MPTSRAARHGVAVGACAGALALAVLVGCAATPSAVSAASIADRPASPVVDPSYAGPSALPTGRATGARPTTQPSAPSVAGPRVTSSVPPAGVPAATSTSSTTSPAPSAPTPPAAADTVDPATAPPASPFAPAAALRQLRPRGNPMAVATVVYTAAVPVAHGCWNVSPAITGVKVFLVQRALGLVGHRERYDSATASAVRSFQSRQGLPVTGVVDATTWSRLRTGYDFCVDRYTAQPVVPLGTLPAKRVEAMIGYAAARLSLPYLWGGAGPLGFDCSGLVLQALYAAGLAPAGITTDKHVLADYRTTQALYASRLPHVPFAQRRRGDLVFYDSPISHMAIYLGAGQVLEAVRPAVRVAREGANGLAPQPYVVRPFPG